MRPVRSHFFVPANREDWVRESPHKYDADAFVFDLEDAVPPADKEDAGEIIRNAYDEFADVDAVIQVRVNEVNGDRFSRDLEQVVRPGLDAILLPKLSTPAEVETADAVLSYLEDVRGIEEPIELVLGPETAVGLNDVHALCRASDRAAVIIGATGEGGDPPRELGYEFTKEGRERLYLLSKVVMEGRAAGIDHLLGGVWMDLEDEAGFEQEARFLKQLGYTSMLTIHPSQIGPVNDVFSPDPAEVERAHQLIEAFEQAQADHTGAIRHEGKLVDTAHLESAKAVIEQAEAFDMAE